MRLILLVACLTLFACSSDSSEEDTVGTEIADDYNRAMDKAAEVEKQVQDHQDAVDEALKKAEEATDD